MSEPRLLGLHHFALPMQDIAATAYFYQTVLQLPLHCTQLDDQLKPRSLWVEPMPGCLLMLELVKTKPTVASPPLPVLALRIHPAQRWAWHQRLQAHHIGITHHSVYSLYFCDPNGNRLALSHHPIASTVAEPMIGQG